MLTCSFTFVSRSWGSPGIKFTEVKPPGSAVTEGHQPCASDYIWPKVERFGNASEISGNWMRFLLGLRCHFCLLNDLDGGWKPYQRFRRARTPSMHASFKLFRRFWIRRHLECLHKRPQRRIFFPLRLIQPWRWYLQSILNLWSRFWGLKTKDPKSGPGDRLQDYQKDILQHPAPRQGRTQEARLQLRVSHGGHLSRLSLHQLYHRDYLLHHQLRYVY